MDKHYKIITKKLNKLASKARDKKPEPNRLNRINYIVLIVNFEPEKHTRRTDLF